MLPEKQVEELQNFIFAKSGITMSNAKKIIIGNKISSILNEKGFSTFETYFNALKEDKSGNFLSELINLVSTNVTHFFREKDHFDYLSSTVLPSITDQLQSINSKDLRIWCAAAATGEEPYSLMMTIMEFFGSAYTNWDAGLLATDISTRALSAAETGSYTKEELKNISLFMRGKYLEQDGLNQYQFKDKIKNEILFRRFNLLDNLPFKQKFHIIFCRNVMIYFQKELKERVVEKLYNALTDGGFLFVGHAESMIGISTKFKGCYPSVYQK